jgi:hypothetical protein
MGGPGSGTWLRNSKNTTDQCHAIDIRELSKKGSLQPGDNGLVEWTRSGNPTGILCYRALEDGIRLIYWYRYNGTWKQVEETLDYDFSDCHFGGVRQWFICPRCSNRVAVIYAGHFACRKCLNLVYESQRENSFLRSIRRWEKTVKKLGGDRWTTGIPDRPRYMHRKTYFRLLREAQCRNRVAGVMLNEWRGKAGGKS